MLWRLTLKKLLLKMSKRSPNPNNINPQLKMVDWSSYQYNGTSCGFSQTIHVLNILYSLQVLVNICRRSGVGGKDITEDKKVSYLSALVTLLQVVPDEGLLLNSPPTGDP